MANSYSDARTILDSSSYYSELSDSIVSSPFEEHVDIRDSFDGERRCVSCGIRSPLTRVYVILVEWPAQYERPEARMLVSATWANQPNKRNIAFNYCLNHAAAFEHGSFYISYDCVTRRFVHVNLKRILEEREVEHGQYLALSVDDPHAVEPELFAANAAVTMPFPMRSPPPPEDTFWPDWVSNGGFLDSQMNLVHQSPQYRVLQGAQSVRTLSASA